MTCRCGEQGNFKMHRKLILTLSMLSVPSACAPTQHGAHGQIPGHSAYCYDDHDRRANVGYVFEHTRDWRSSLYSAFPSEVKAEAPVPAATSSPALDLTKRGNPVLSERTPAPTPLGPKPVQRWWQRPHDQAKHTSPSLSLPKRPVEFEAARAPTQIELPAEVLAERQRFLQALAAFRGASGATLPKRMSVHQSASDTIMNSAGASIKTAHTT